MRNCILSGTITNSITPNYSTGAIQFGGGQNLHANGLLFEQNLAMADYGNLLYFGHSMDDGKIRNNRFNGDTVAFGPFGERTGWVIEGNEFNGNVPGHGPYWGFGFNANLGDVIIRNNIVSKMLVGIGQISVVDGSITGNTFDDNAFAAFQLWGGEWGSVVSTNVRIIDNVIKYNGTDCTGSGDASHGIRLRPGLDASTIHLRYNCFEDLGTGTCGEAWAIRQNGLNQADAELNWWGISDQAAIAAMFGEGDVDYDPWLTGIDYTGDKAFTTSENIVLQAKVNTSDNIPVEGFPVWFLVDDSVVGGVPTDISGTATMDLGIKPEGSYSVEAKCAAGCLSTGTTTVTVGPPMAFAINNAKIDWKKKPDDDKLFVKGTFNLPEGANADPNSVSLTVGRYSFGPVSMDVKDKGKQWEYKRSKGMAGIKDMKIEWKQSSATFEIHIDKAELGSIAGWTNPVSIKLQIGSYKGSEDVLMNVLKDKWEYNR